jgi:Protein of unknown function (DUF1360)
MLRGLSPLTLIVAVLALWRVTHLFWGEDGPADIFVRLRRSAGNGFWGSLLDCFYCLSLWFAAPLAYVLGASWPDRILLWFGLSGGAILLERATSHRAPPPAVWHEEPLPEKETKENNNHVLLR